MDMFDRLVKAVTEREADYDKERKQDLPFLGCAIAGEVGELCNLIKKMERTRLGLQGSTATEQDALDEIADIFIYGIVIGTRIGTPSELEQAIVRKFNAFSAKTGSKTFL